MARGGGCRERGGAAGAGAGMQPGAGRRDAAGRGGAGAGHDGARCGDGEPRAQRSTRAAGRRAWRGASRQSVAANSVIEVAASSASLISVPWPWSGTSRSSALPGTCDMISRHH